MQAYKDWAPTVFDSKGYLLDNRQDWLVGLIKTRDSDALESSNFDSALELLSGESDTVAVHAFNHWGPGWFKIILVHPSRLSELQGIAKQLEDYPVLNEEDFSRREFEQVCESWADLHLSERIEMCKTASVSIFAARQDNPYEVDPGDGSITDRLLY